MRRIPIGLIMLTVASAAAAQDRSPIVLQPGEAISVRLDGDGATLARENPGPADLTPFDLTVARHLSGLTPPNGPAPAMALPMTARCCPSPWWGGTGSACAFSRSPISTAF